MLITVRYKVAGQIAVY